MACRAGLDPREVTTLVLIDGGGTWRKGKRQRCIRCRLQNRTLCLREKEYIIWAQSGKAAWMRWHVNCAEESRIWIG